jgi:hypothetical protein
MKNEREKLDVQDAPDKNNDKAFVQVDSDGKPLVPQTNGSEQSKTEEPPKEGTLADR